MKTFLAFLLLSTLGLSAEVEFSGFFTTSKVALFSLTNTEAQRSSGWLKIGESFGGYTVISFDREHEILTLIQADRLLKLPLLASKVKDGRATISGSLKFMNEQIEGVRASLFFDEETTFPLKHGITFRIRPEKRPDGNIAYHAKFISRDKDGGEQILATPSVTAIPGSPFSIQVADFGYSFTP